MRYGNSWPFSRIGEVQEIPSPFAGRWPKGVNSLFFDHTACGTVHGFDGSTFWRSTDRGSSWTEFEVKQPGMRAMMRGKMATAQFNSVVQDPADPQAFYAGSRSNRDPGTAVFKTTNVAPLIGGSGAI